jgi:hypothetical protein
MVVKVDTQIVQEASTVTFGILKEVITNTNISIIIENDDDGDTQKHVSFCIPIINQDYAPFLHLIVLTHYMFQAHL